ncbi:L-2-hydroxyglutarate oxidase [Amphritea balenae]|uniref:L-2-hydroxyglutarate oxidase n=1 Tax=Amphritea balenae TaxID=452629 RepID=A0A3P1SRB0_9GAMM|nr:L-2-hydroxyglutarate oxidase [Amphritea balenae]RRC99599.1 L-2-hydroxyglutarate oxidase [Amphritea balenae]GGK78331.1 hydroxyglutarate oxidase [Amphritea balenae]
MIDRYDYLIVGGGIVGLSTAWQLQQQCPDKRIGLLEKESSFAQHQTGHNSGVIHAGVYYAPGSLKAEFCREGVEKTIAFCQENDIKYDQCGKLLVATNELEHERMLALYERCHQNQLDVELLDAKQLKEREPNIQGLGAILVKTTGIVDYRQVCNKMAERFCELGGETLLSTEVTGMEESSEEITVKTNQGTLHCRYLICCSGLMADRLTRMLDIETDFQIVPFRGEYYRLPNEKSDIVNHLIYPIPDPELPFLGVHLTRMIDGSVTVGPNAVQGWKREGYGRINISLRDIWDMLRFPGFWRVLKQHIGTGIIETKNSLWKPGYLKLVQKYCPSVQVKDLQPYPAGIRAQAVMRDGSLVHDFLFAESPRSLHVCNAPSPAATSAIPIGRHIIERVMAASTD